MNASPVCFSFILLFAAIYLVVELTERHIDKIRRNTK